MVSIAAAVLAAALLCWPAGAGRLRLSSLRGPSAAPGGAPSASISSTAAASGSTAALPALGSPRGGLVLGALSRQRPRCPPASLAASPRRW